MYACGSEARSSHHAAIVESCRGYFFRNPYDGWFKQLDHVIDVYAQAIAASEASPQYQQAAAALRENLTAYYKYRHNNSTDGMQALIDRYKKK